MNPFSSSGANIPKMFGRKKVCYKILAMLDKPNPDHVSLVGPKQYGKTVLLNYLRSYMLTAGKYVASVFMDIRHNTPQSDNEFRIYLARHLRDALSPVNVDYAKILSDSGDDSVPDSIRIILNDLKDKKQRIIILFDSFDHLPLGTAIQPQLLDQLRSFAQIESLRLVIGSRKRLRELCKTEASRTSDFWRIFAEPVRIGSFDDDDIEDVWGPFTKRSIEIEAGAKTEFRNQTGGVPLFVAGLLKKLYDSASDGQKITQREMIELTKDFCRESQDAIVDIWEDCDLELRNLVVNGCAGEAPTNAYPNLLLEEAVSRGFLKKEGNQMKSHSRILADFAKSQSSSVQDMHRLFAKKGDFEKNMKGVLELRLSQVNNFSDELINYVKHSIRDMDDGPKLVLDNARGIVDQACKFIVNEEGVKDDGRLPQAWIEKWRTTNIEGPPAGIDPFPSDRGKQVTALRYICGCDNRYVKVSNKISRQSFTLLRTLNELGNFSNHSYGEQVLAGTAVILCMTAIELIESLSRDCEIN